MSPMVSPGSDKQGNPAEQLPSRKMVIVMRKYLSKFALFSTEQQLLLNIADLMGKDPIDADGKKYKAADVAALVQKRLDARSNARQARVSLEKAVADERKTLEATNDELAVIRDALREELRHALEGTK